MLGYDVPLIIGSDGSLNIGAAQLAAFRYGAWHVRHVVQLAAFRYGAWHVRHVVELAAFRYRTYSNWDVANYVAQYRANKTNPGCDKDKPPCDCGVR